ncbi:MAG: hypothetical protein LC674_00265 [Actinobacteria bacterium]|nr:hypothetical protein [Actinomycetota bacterium]
MSETVAFEPSAYKFNLWGSPGTAAAPARELREESVRQQIAHEAIYKQLTPSDRFQILVEDWKRSSRLLSSTAQMARLEAYQQIIQMGHTAIPLILRELEKEPDYWFIALEKISGENPVRNEVGGRLHLMADAWLRWGRERHLL